MGNLSPFFLRLHRTMESKTFRYTLSALYCVNFVSFMLLLTCDCLKWWRLGPGGARLLAAGALALSSYLVWMLYTFLTVGALVFRSSQAQDESRRWRSLVMAIGLPLLYAVYAAWGFSSTTGQAAWLGELSIGAFVAYDIAYLLAILADRKPRPPAAQREALSQEAHRRTA